MGYINALHLHQNDKIKQDFLELKIETVKPKQPLHQHTILSYPGEFCVSMLRISLKKTVQLYSVSLGNVKPFQCFSRWTSQRSCLCSDPFLSLHFDNTEQQCQPLSPSHWQRQPFLKWFGNLIKKWRRWVINVKLLHYLSAIFSWPTLPVHTAVAHIHGLCINAFV